jgi:hypothetical protein
MMIHVYELRTCHKIVRFLSEKFPIRGACVTDMCFCVCDKQFFVCLSVYVVCVCVGSGQISIDPSTRVHTTEAVRVSPLFVCTVVASNIRQ